MKKFLRASLPALYICAATAGRDDQARFRRRLRAEADDRMIGSPAKQSYTADVPTLRPMRHPGAYSIN
ncbi:MAG: hypothetical protein J2P52_06110 [Blastocatellia bacterium]|nr:hypothetical protein [Blastocatellia bacterium]